MLLLDGDLAPGTEHPRSPDGRGGAGPTKPQLQVHFLFLPYLRPWEASRASVLNLLVSCLLPDTPQPPGKASGAKFPPTPQKAPMPPEKGLLAAFWVPGENLGEEVRMGVPGRECPALLSLWRRPGVETHCFPPLSACVWWEMRT